MLNFSVFDLPYYEAPEVISGDSDYSLASDIWTLGVILYKMLMKKNPFEASNYTDLCREILHKEPSALNNDMPEYRELINLMLSKDRQARPNIEQVILRLPKTVETLTLYREQGLFSWCKDDNFIHKQLAMFLDHTIEKPKISITPLNFDRQYEEPKEDLLKMVKTDSEDAV